MMLNIERIKKTKIVFNAKGKGTTDNKTKYYRFWFFQHKGLWVLLIRYFKFVLQVTWKGENQNVRKHRHR